MTNETMYIMCLSKGVEAIKQSIKEGVLPNKKLGFIPTAGETYPNPYFVEESRVRLQDLGLELVEVDVTNKTHDELASILNSIDGTYVAGGNSFWLLQQLQKKQLVSVIQDLVKKGKPYFGESAGAVILYSTIEPIKVLDDPQDAPDIESYKALDLVDFIALPHIDREKYKDVMGKFLTDNKEKYKIVPFRDDQVILTRNGMDFEILDSDVRDVTS
jgi:dipeptidase E